MTLMTGMCCTPDTICFRGIWLNGGIIVLKILRDVELHFDMKVPKNIIDFSKMSGIDFLKCI